MARGVASGGREVPARDSATSGSLAGSGAGTASVRRRIRVVTGSSAATVRRVPARSGVASTVCAAFSALICSTTSEMLGNGAALGSGVAKRIGDQWGLPPPGGGESVRPSLARMTGRGDASQPGGSEGTTAYLGNRGDHFRPESAGAIMVMFLAIVSCFLFFRVFRSAQVDPFPSQTANDRSEPAGQFQRLVLPAPGFTAHAGVFFGDRGA